MSEILNYCPECRSEYREGFTVCADCGVSLVRRLDMERGDPLVPLAREKSFELVAELLDRLEKEEIPYVVQAGTALALLDGQPPDKARPEEWEARVWVARSKERDAAELFEQLVDEWRHERGQQAATRYLDTTRSRTFGGD